MASQLLQLSLYNSQCFLAEVGIIPSNYSRFCICLMFSFLETLLYVLQQFSPILKKEKSVCDFHTKVLCFCRFCLSLVLRNVLIYFRYQSVCCHLQFQIRNSGQNQHTLWKTGTDVFRTYSNIYKGAFFQKQLTA